MSDDLPPRMRAAMADVERVLDGRGPQRARQQRLDRAARATGPVIDVNEPGQDVVVSSDPSLGGGGPIGERR